MPDPGCSRRWRVVGGRIVYLGSIVFGLLAIGLPVLAAAVPLDLIGGTELVALVALLVLLLGVHLVIRLNHRLRREIRNRWRAEDMLSESQQRLALALWGADIGCWDWNLEADEVFLDGRSAELLGVEAGEGVLSLHDSHPACKPFWQLRERILKEHSDPQLEQVSQLGDRWLQFTGKRLTHGNTRYRALGTLMDISQVHNYQQKLERLSITDSLTGVFNRRHFFERLAPACAQARRDGSALSIAMLDIDHFKGVNDRYGHPFGDRVLVHFAALLVRHCRPYDLVGRYGGEEFVVLFAGIDRRQARTVLSRYRQALLAAPLQAEGEPLICRFSAGLADLCENGDGHNLCEGLVAIADSRLYQAKHAGRDRIVIDDGAD